MIRSTNLTAFLPGFAPYPGPDITAWPWHRAWVEHRKLNRLDHSALADIGMSFSDRAAVTVEIIFRRMQSGR